MPAISVGSVEVDVVPSTQGIRQRLQNGLLPAANSVGDEMGRVMARYLATHIAQGVRDGVTQGGRTAQGPAARQGSQTGSAFARGFKTRLEAALRDLPEVRLNANSTDAEREIANIRAQMAALRDVRIGIDIGEADARAALARLQARLTRLSESRANVAVRVDAGAAAAQLAAFQAEISRLDGRSVDVDVDTHAAAANLNLLTTAALTLGPSILPVLPVIAAGLGAIAAAGVAAGAGIGGIALVAAPAFKGIASALQAQKAAQDAATSSTASGAATGASAARQAMQQASAQQALATAQRNAARQIADAEKAVGAAVRQAAQNNAQAAAQVKSARQSLADAYAQAAERMQSANKQVEQAERDLSTAQKSARQAQLDLTAARKEAAQQLEDLNNRLVDGQLSQRDAEIALKEATAERNKVLASATSTELDKQKAILQYDQAVQRLKEQTTETKRLKVETTAANKAGVDGSDTVRSAQERLASAQQDVVDRTAAVRDAQQNVTKTQIANSRAIADAQDKLATAQRNVAETQRQGAEAIAAAQERVVQAQQSGADSIASAQRQIASASLSAAGGVDQAAVAQAKYRAELAKLSPAARGTFNAFIQLRSAFGAWSKSLQPQVMPIFTRALNGIRRALPALTPFVKDAAAAVRDLQDRFSRQIKTPFWQGFKNDLQGSVKPAITGLGVSFGQTVKGMAGVVDAFLPHMDGISKKMQSLTGRFANWGTSLKGSPQFEEFLSFSADKAPLIGKALGDVARAFLEIGKALTPVSGPILKVISILADGIATVAEHAPWLVLAIWGIIAAIRIWTVVQWALNAAMTANPWTLIVIAIIALIAGIVYAYNKFGWFRAGVQAAWNGIKTASLWVWNTVLKPFFAWFGQIVTWLWTSIIKPYIGFIIAYWKTVASVVMWVWRTVLSPVFGFLSLAARILATIWVTVLVVAFKVWWTAAKTYFNAVAAIAKWLWNSVLSPVIGFIIGGFQLWWAGAKFYFGLVKGGFRAVGAIAKWLWQKGISPVFHLIVGGAKWMWGGVKVVFGYFRDGIKTLAGWAKWLHTKAVKPAWDGIVSAGRSAYDRGIRPVFDGWKRITRGMGDVFKTAVVAIKKQWDKVKNIAKIPVSFVVNRVYNDGLVGVWNKVAGAFGAPKLKKYHFASGGIMPGYTPGRDVHRFVSPTGGQLDLSGGEAIMRPEFTRAVGSGFVGSLNSLARSRGAQGVKAALAPVLGGNPRTPTDRSLPYKRGGILPVQRFADGGIFGWIKKTASSAVGAGSDAWNAIKKTASWLKDTLESSARAGVKNVVNPLLNSFPGMDTGFGRMIRRIPNKMIDTLFGYAKKSDDKGAGGIGGPRIDAALRWARTQAGKPYQWAGNGNPSWDCLTLSSMITTPEGHTTLGDLHPGMEVMAYQDGRLVASKVRAKWNTGEQELFKVRTRNRSIRATAGHRVLVAAPVKRPMMDVDERVSMAEWGTDWKEVRDLTPSDYLVTYTGSAKEGGEDVPEDLAWLMGLWLADGSVNQSGGIRICVYDDLAEKAMAVLRKYSPNRKVAHHPRHGVMISDVQRVRWMARNGFYGKSHERTIPPVVMEWSQAAQDAFLEGYADGDGSYRNGATFETAELIEYKATSRDLIEGIREMHIRRGDRVSVTNTQVRTKDIYIGGKKIENARPLHSIEVAPGRGVNQTTGAGHRPGLLRLVARLREENMSVQRVLSVEPDGMEETWDIEVEDSHSFVSDGLISHNCSGFMSAIESVIRGQKPHRRWATMAFSGKTAPPGWVYHGNSAFKVGITNAGVGHTAGTLGKTNVESRGGDGVVVGPRARGYKAPLFTSWYGFQPGKYDSGGYLQPGLNLAYNGTGRPEPVFTTQQANALARSGGAGGGPASFEGNLFLDSGEFLGRVRGEAQQVVAQNNGTLLTALNARPRR